MITSAFYEFFLRLLKHSAELRCTSDSLPITYFRFRSIYVHGMYLPSCDYKISEMRGVFNSQNEWSVGAKTVEYGETPAQVLIYPNKVRYNKYIVNPGNIAPDLLFISEK